MSKKFENYWKHRQALEKLPFTTEEKERWARMFHMTWAAIAGDVEEGCRLSKCRLTKGILVETVCDCDHVLAYGGMTKEENEFLHAVYRRPSFQRWIRKELNYV